MPNMYTTANLVESHFPKSKAENSKRISKLICFSMHGESLSKRVLSLGSPKVHASDYPPKPNTVSNI